MCCFLSFFFFSSGGANGSEKIFNNKGGVAKGDVEGEKREEKRNKKKMCGRAGVPHTGSKESDDEPWRATKTPNLWEARFQLELFIACI